MNIRFLKMSSCHTFCLLLAPILQSPQSEEELSSQPGAFSEDAEDAACGGFKLLVEEEGYEADSESNSEDSEAQDDGKISGSTCDSVCKSDY